MNFDVNNVVKRLRKLESTLKNKIESGALYTEVKRYADGQAKTLKQKVKSSKDAKKVLAFIEKRKKQIEKLAADLPGEVKTVRSYVKTQRKELEKLGNELLQKARDGKLNATTLRTALRTATTAKAASTTTTTTAKRATSKKAAGTKKKAKRK